MHVTGTGIACLNSCLEASVSPPALSGKNQFAWFSVVILALMVNDGQQCLFVSIFQLIQDRIGLTSLSKAHLASERALRDS